MNKTVVAVVVYDRIKNVQRWIDVWQKSEIQNAELRIIHNVHPNESLDKIAHLVSSAGITYIPRHNVGMDIGAFQDVCRRRLNGFNYDFKNLIWLTDDTFPMRKSFVDEFTALLANPKIGLTCYEISPQVMQHVRTTGFCMRSETLEKIVFEADPITTKHDCYQFEHQGSKTLFTQMHTMGMDIIQIGSVASSPVWDSGGGGVKWPDREDEFLRYWKINRPPSKVIVISTAYNRYPTIVHSMMTQTYPNWELHLVHDGPASHDYPRFSDERVIFTEMPMRRKDYGHPIRMDWLEKVKAKEIKGDYVVVTNDDNYHVPHFIEKLIKPLESNPDLIGSYCSQMVHNYKGYGDEVLEPGQDHIIDGYGVIDTRPEIGYIDCAAAVIRSEIAGPAGWPSTRHSSDWDYLNNIAVRNGGWNRFARVNGALLVHS